MYKKALPDDLFQLYMAAKGGHRILLEYHDKILDFLTQEFL